jgi:DNA-binding IclR family transcriptional regulator
MSSGTETASKVQVIDRAVDILRTLSRHPDGMTLTDLSTRTKLHKATVLRFLKSLEHNGMVEQARSGKFWMLGSLLFEMANRANRSDDLRELARPIMEDACRDIHETVQLAVLSSNEVVYVEKVEPNDMPLKINTQVGSRRPVYCTALGKVLCADLDWNEVEAMLVSAGMEARTKQTVTDHEAFHAMLDHVREAGYSVDDREYNELVVCTAAPVRNSSGKVVAGLSISAFGITTDSDRFRDIVTAARNTAGRISERLGFEQKAEVDA